MQITSPARGMEGMMATIRGHRELCLAEAGAFSQKIGCCYLGAGFAPKLVVPAEPPPAKQLWRGHHCTALKLAAQCPVILASSCCNCLLTLQPLNPDTFWQRISPCAAPPHGLFTLSSWHPSHPSHHPLVHPATPHVTLHIRATREAATPSQFPPAVRSIPPHHGLGRGRAGRPEHPDRH